MLAHHQNSGLNCAPGIECGFIGQIAANCVNIVVSSILLFEMAIFLTFWLGGNKPFGAVQGTGIACSPA